MISRCDIQNQLTSSKIKHIQYDNTTVCYTSPGVELSHLDPWLYESASDTINSCERSDPNPTNCAPKQGFWGSFLLAPTLHLIHSYPMASLGILDVRQLVSFRKPTKNSTTCIWSSPNKFTLSSIFRTVKVFQTPRPPTQNWYDTWSPGAGRWSN